MTSRPGRPNSSMRKALRSVEPSGPVAARPFPLWAILVLSAVGYLALALAFPLPGNSDWVPPLDVRSFAPALGEGLLYAVLVGGLFWLLVLAFRRLWETGLEGLPLAGRPLAGILLVALLLGLPLLFVYPINAIDVYTYFLQGRIAATYSANPYLVAPNQLTGDPFVGLTGEWARETPPYGPVWVLLSAGVSAVSSAISDRPVLPALLMFKSLGLAFYVLSSALLGSLAGSQSRRGLAYTVLWAWNPALYLEFVANAHNDALMLLFLIAGYWLVRRGRPATGFLVMVLAVLTKPIALLALPIFFVAILRRLDGQAARARFAAITVGGALLLSALAFAAWADPAAPLATPLSLLSRLAREAGDVIGFSVPVMLWFGSRQRIAVETFALVGMVGFAIFYLWLLWRTGHGRAGARSTADAFAGYLLQARSFRIWYAAWPFPWLVLDAAAPESGEIRPYTGYRLRAGFWLLLTAQLSVVIYGHIRIAWLDGQHALAHLIGVPFTFLLPLLLAKAPFVRDVAGPEAQAPSPTAPAASETP